MTDANRGSWGSGGGFVLAAAGSAVGLGNIWKFPYMAGQNGGAAFIIVYLGIIFTIGISVMLAEIVIGRAARRNPVGAFRSLKGGAWPALGYVGVIGATITPGLLQRSRRHAALGATMAAALRRRRANADPVDPDQRAIGSTWTQPGHWVDENGGQLV